MTDAALIAFLEWAVPRLGLRWEGLRNFRPTVRKRLTKRIIELGLADLDAYRARLDRDDAEWAVLDAMCHIPISRLYRDHAVYDRLSAEILLARARRGAYGPGSVRALPPRLRDLAMKRAGDGFVVRDELRGYVTFRREDLRQAMPDGPFDVVLCRNVLLTYLEESLHLPLLEQMVSRLLPGGVLVVGIRESMPELPSLARVAAGIYGAAFV